MGSRCRGGQSVTLCKEYMNAQHGKQRQGDVDSLDGKDASGGIPANVKREIAIQALMDNPDVKKAAYACDISERTLRQWLNESDFSEHHAEARSDTTKIILCKSKGNSVSITENNGKFLITIKERTYV